MNADQRAAATDRAIYLGWAPQGRPGTPNYSRGQLARGGQMAIAMVDAYIRSAVGTDASAIEKRIAQNVRTMR